MLIDYLGVREINGSLIVLDDVEGASFEEVVDIRLEDGTLRQGRVVQMEGSRVSFRCSRARVESRWTTRAPA